VYIIVPDIIVTPVRAFPGKSSSRVGMKPYFYSGW